MAERKETLNYARIIYFYARGRGSAGGAGTGGPEFESRQPCKKPEWWHVLLTRLWGGRDRQIPGAYRPASLAE